MIKVFAKKGARGWGLRGCAHDSLRCKAAACRKLKSFPGTWFNKASGEELQRQRCQSCPPPVRRLLESYWTMNLRKGTHCI